MTRRGRAAVCAALLVAAGTTGVAYSMNATGTESGGGTQPDVAVTVNSQDHIGAIPSVAFGLNASAYDGHLLDSSIPQLIRATGVSTMRYPGGSEADTYHWADNSITPGQAGSANLNDSFDNFMKVATTAGTQVIMTVNYGTNRTGTAGGDPQEAADWVRYANMGGPGYTGVVPTYPGASPTGHSYGIKYWEVGNELYGNGSYGANWEADLHGDKAEGPAAYGRHAAEFITAMKGVDPSIKVGVVLTAPSNWPDEDVIGVAGTPRAWNDTVLKATCTGLDFVNVHWYPQDPGTESDVKLLQSPHAGIGGRTASIPAMVSRLRAEISQQCPGRARQIEVMITETNSVAYNPGKQTVNVVNALFAADAYLTWLENGVSNVDWWQLHNGPVQGTYNSPTLYGTASYGDYGILSNGDAPEPAANKPFPAYYGLQMLSHVGRSGDLMVRAASDTSLVTVHAVVQANGDLAVLLINKDPQASHTVALALPDYAAAANPTVYAYGPNSRSITSAIARGVPATESQTIGPYSLTTIVFSPKPLQK